MDKPLKSVTHNQCDARPTVTFPAAWHHRPLTGTIILLGDRGTCVWTTCPRLLPETGMALRWLSSQLQRVSKKSRPFNSINNSVKNKPTSVIFCTQNLQIAVSVEAACLAVSRLTVSIRFHLNCVGRLPAMLHLDSLIFPSPFTIFLMISKIHPAFTDKSCLVNRQRKWVRNQ